jgi:hypothetical protein
MDVLHDETCDHNYHPLFCGGHRQRGPNDGTIHGPTFETLDSPTLLKKALRDVSERVKKRRQEDAARRQKADEAAQKKQKVDQERQKTIEAFQARKADYKSDDDDGDLSDGIDGDELLAKLGYTF